METTIVVVPNLVDIIIDGKNVTGDVSRYLSQITYTDNLEGESDDVSLTFEDVDGNWASSWYPSQGDSMIIRMGDALDKLYCGVFEIDEIGFEFPPSTFNVKAIAAAISKNLRTKNGKAFEKQSLKKIAQFFADKHGLKLTGNIGELSKIQIERKTQDNQTDISFLSSLAKEYGLIFSVRGDMLVFMSSNDLEKSSPAVTFSKRQISKASFQDKTSQVYASATVATRDTRTNSVKKYNIKSAGNAAEKDTLVISGRVENDSQAEAKAKGALKDKNKDKITGSLTVPGNVMIISGINIELVGLGAFSGIWHVIQSTHTINKDSGYTTSMNIRKLLN